MSLFFKSAPEKEYVLLCEEIQERCSAIAQQRPGIEAYEALMVVWCEQMQKRGKPHLAGPLAGAGWVKLPALLEPLDSITMLGQLIGMHTIKKFSTTKYYANLNESLSMLMRLELQDADGLNRLFREQNPKSYDTFVNDYQDKPFDKESLEYYLKILSSQDN